MALIRGVGSLSPCPRCLILDGELGDLSVRAPLRTTADTQAKLREARAKQNVTDGDNILKAVGLRDVDVRFRSYYPCFVLLLTTPKNVFWKINNSDPYGALSFDRLHTFPGGLFRHHLWERLQTRIKALGREASVVVDEMYVRSLISRYHISLVTYDSADSIPRWRGLNHFQTYLSVDFTDGSKWEDMSKVRHC